eukprot:PITA_20692
MVTHHQFVDDTMIQGTPSVKEAKAFKWILSEFAREAGIEVSLTKSKIFFFNIDILIQRNISRILGIQRESLPAQYLGVPLINKLLHKDICEPILNKLEDKISKWTNRALNLVGRPILNKAILQSIPIYILSAILAPTCVITNIKNIHRYFLCGNGEEKKKWALVAWDKQQEDNLRREELADIHIATINKGLRLVHDYWDQSRNNKKWRTWKLSDYNGMGMLHTRVIALKGLLDKRQILTSTLDDQLKGGRNKAGLFNLKEAKRIDSGLNLPNIDKTWKEIWDNPHCMKVKLFKWLVQQAKILTWDNLRKRGFVDPSRCHLCRQQEETTNHLLNRCTFTTIFWNWVGEVFEQIDKNVNDIIVTLKKWRKVFFDNEIINST